MVSVELPTVGAPAQGHRQEDGDLRDVESLKALSDLFAPVSGEVLEVAKAYQAYLAQGAK